MDMVNKNFSIIILLVLLNCIHKELDAFATLYLTFQNKTDEVMGIKYVKPKTLERGDSVYITGQNSIILKSDSLTIGPFENIDDIIGYQFIGVDNCYIEEATSKNFRLDVLVFNAESLYLKTSVFPWDTSKGTGKFLDDCHKESWDTLIIE